MVAPNGVVFGRVIRTSLSLIAIFSIFGSFFLMGCLSSLKPEETALRAISTSPRTTPDCAGCHAYPLHDVNHNYHLRAFNPREGMQGVFMYERKNGILVCMDCHFSSITNRKYTWYDTIWGIEGELRSNADKLPGDLIYRIDSIPGFLAIPAGYDVANVTSDRVNFMIDSAAKMGAMISWLTGKDHMNGRVDVSFSPNIVLDSALSKTAYRPKDLSCSSIECHNAPKKKYRWASTKMRLNGCPTLGHTPEEDSSCNYSPKQEP